MVIQQNASFDNEQAAHAFAADFKLSWGLGYDGRATVYRTKTGWAVSASRMSSCD